MRVYAHLVAKSFESSQLTFWSLHLRNIHVYAALRGAGVAPRYNLEAVTANILDRAAKPLWLGSTNPSASKSAF